MKGAIFAACLFFAVVFSHAQDCGDVIRFLEANEVRPLDFITLHNGAWRLLLLNDTPIDAYYALLGLGVAIEPDLPEGDILLVSAISHNNADAVGFFLRRGANPNQQGRFGVTPLQVAARDSGNSEIFQLLLNAGAQVNPTEYDSSFGSPFELILRRNSAELTRLFINAGADVRRISGSGSSPMEFAAGNVSDPEIFRLLIDAGASVTSRGAGGRTPLHRAAGTSRVTNVALLIELGADIDAADEQGLTPLMLASSIYGNMEILINAGADVNIQSNEGKTALMFSARFGFDPRAISILLDAGADARLEDNAGRTALDWLDLNRRLYRHPIRRDLRDRTL